MMTVYAPMTLTNSATTKVALLVAHDPAICEDLLNRPLTKRRQWDSYEAEAFFLDYFPNGGDDLAPDELINVNWEDIVSIWNAL